MPCYTATPKGAGPKACEVLGRLLLLGRAEVSTEPSPPAVPFRKRPERRSADTTTVRQVVTGHLPLGTKSPHSFRNSAAVATISLTCLPHIYDDAGPKTHTEARFREFNVFHWFYACSGNNISQPEREQQSLDRSNTYQVVARYALHCRSISTVTRKVYPCVVSNTPTLYIYGFFQIITSRTRKASKKNYVHITQ